MSSDALVGIAFRILGSVHEVGSGHWQRRDFDLGRSLAATATPRWLPDLPGRIEGFVGDHERSRLASRETPEAYYWRVTGDALRQFLTRGGFSDAHRFASMRLAKLTVPIELMIPDADPVLDALRPAIVNDLFQLGLADAHVHSGAAVPFTQLLLRLLSEPMDRQAKLGVLGFDHNGREFDIGALAAGVRVGWWALSAMIDGRPLDAGVASATLRRSIGQGSYWEELRSAITESTEIRTHFLSSVMAEGTENWGIADPGLLSIAVERAAGQEVPWRVHLAELLRAVSLLRGAATSVPGEGLTRFVARFNSLRVIRRAGGRDPAALVCQAAKAVGAGGNVHKFELRKTEYPDRGPFYEELRDTLQCHLEGVGRALRARNQECAFQMPIGFHRQGSRPWRDARAARAPRFDMSAHYALVDAWTELASRHPEAARYAASFDVAGDEDNFPNWPFAVIFSEIEQRWSIDHQPQFSIHCGESFPTPLTGLRRVGDCLLFPTMPHRLGHALALSPEAARFQVPSTISGLEYCTAAEVLDDLAWAAAVFGASIMDDRQRAASDRMVSIAYPGQQVNLLDVADAYRGRFLRERLLEVGFLHRDTLEPTWTHPVSGFRPQRKASLAGQLLRNFLYGVAAGGISVDLDAVVPSDLIAELAAVSDSLYDTLVPLVTEALTARGVVIESCPTSNSVLGHLAGAWHPWNFFVSRGLNVTVNTDDPGVFHNHIYDEYEALLYSGDFNITALDELRERSFKCCSPGVAVAASDTYLGLARSLRQAERPSA